MGLDAYIRHDFKVADDEIESSELWYGRKENEIHGWMQRESAVAAEEFNCVEFPLTAALLHKLEADLQANNLVTTKGFFFGGPGAPEHVKEAVQDLLVAARKALDNGQKPYYTSSW
jgi:hypothetical protein